MSHIAAQLLPCQKKTVGSLEPSCWSPKIMQHILHGTWPQGPAWMARPCPPAMHKIVVCDTMHVAVHIWPVAHLLSRNAGRVWEGGCRCIFSLTALLQLHLQLFSLSHNVLHIGHLHTAHTHVSAHA